MRHLASPPEAAVTAAAAEAVARLAELSEEVRDDVCEMGGVPWLVHLLSFGPDAPVASAAAGALWYLARNNGNKDVVRDAGDDEARARGVGGVGEGVAGEVRRSVEQDRRNVEQVPRLRGCDREADHGSIVADPLRASGVRSPKGPLFRPATRPVYGMRPRRRTSPRISGTSYSSSVSHPSVSRRNLFRSPRVEG